MTATSDTAASPRILQSNPGASYQTYREEIDAAVQRVLASGWYILGREVEAFEAEFADFVGCTHGIGVGNGTDALEIALRACGIGAGDVVFTVAHTAVATVAAVERCGAVAWLVDVEPATGTMSAAAFAAALSEARRAEHGRPAAVVPVHLYGHAADLPAIEELARAAGLAIVEDCAQAHGASLHGRPLASWGDVAAFSFYPTKNLGAFGDGGLVATRDDGIAERARLLRQYGWQRRYISEISGGNTRLDELHAAILRVKLARLEEDNGRRRALAAAYDRLLSGSSLQLPAVAPGAVHVYHQYAVRTPQRDALRAALAAEGIQTLVHYPVPVHLQPAYQGRLPGADRLPESEAAAREVLSLPLYPELPASAVEEVARAIRRWDSGER